MTLVDESYLTSCPRCGSVVLRQDQATHNLFHQAIVDLGEGTEQLIQGLDQLAKVSRELWNAIQALTAQVVDLRRRAELTAQVVDDLRRRIEPPRFREVHAGLEDDL